MEVVILADWREQFLRPYRMGRLTLCSMRSMNLSRGFVMDAEPDLILATVLFTDIVDSTKQAAEMGDRKWGELLQQHHVIVRRELARFRGREVNTAGDGLLICFDGPGRAIRCGMSISRQVRSLGIDTVSRPSSRNSLSEGARVHENIRTLPGAAKECAGIRNLADRAVT